ncbi:hypothetical protein IG631_24062 [Alternaria alternata]|nr:hypothetical protein IG631_24062 [Alternaria alternata]
MDESSISHLTILRWIVRPYVSADIDVLRCTWRTCSARFSSSREASQSSVVVERTTQVCPSSFKFSVRGATIFLILAHHPAVVNDPVASTPPQLGQASGSQITSCLPDYE